MAAYTTAHPSLSLHVLLSPFSTIQPSSADLDDESDELDGADPLDVAMSGDAIDDAADELAAEEENALAAEAEYEHVRSIVTLTRAWHWHTHHAFGRAVSVSRRSEGAPSGSLFICFLFAHLACSSWRCWLCVSAPASFIASLLSAANFECDIRGNVGFNIAATQIDRMIDELRQRRQLQRRHQQPQGADPADHDDSASESADADRKEKEKPLLIVKKK